MRIGKDDVGRVCTEDDVAELDAMWGNIAEREIVLAGEFGKVVKEDEEETSRPAGCRSAVLKKGPTNLKSSSRSL